MGELNIQGQAIKIEITESTLIKNADISKTILEKLRLSGIDICIDDFGTGYSSLSYLHNFPINTLKIDRSFISNLKHNQDNREIVKAIVNLGINLNLTVIAEGIETEEQCRELIELGCHCGQGFWFSRPLSMEHATALLQQSYSDRHIGL